MAARGGTHLDTDQVGVIELDGQPVEYTMRRSLRRKRAMLSLSDRGLVLAVPLRMSLRAIEGFLQHSHPWLRRHLPRWRANARPHLELTMLQQLLWLGEPLPIDVARAHASRSPCPSRTTWAPYAPRCAPGCRRTPCGTSKTGHATSRPSSA
jgi:predicted metal-dependent hydrolase